MIDEISGLGRVIPGYLWRNGNNTGNRFGGKIEKLKIKIVDLCNLLLKEKHVIGSAGNVSFRITDNEKKFVLITKLVINCITFIS